MLEQAPSPAAGNHGTSLSAGQRLATLPANRALVRQISGRVETLLQRVPPIPQRPTPYRSDRRGLWRRPSRSPPTSAQRAYGEGTRRVISNTPCGSRLPESYV